FSCLRDINLIWRAPYSKVASNAACARSGSSATCPPVLWRRAIPSSPGSFCPPNTVLFREGQPARGVFVLCEGRAKLSVCSESGRRLTLGIAVPGEVLGLSASLSGSVCEVTAELVDNAQLAMVKRKDL